MSRTHNTHKRLHFFAATAMCLSLLAVGLLLTRLGSPAQALGRPIVFYVPHQDDELLSMGAVIRQHVLVGRDVHVVLVTDGSASAAKKKVEAKLGKPITVEQFVQARDNEFRASLSKLGVPTAKIHIEPDPVKRIKDGQLTRQLADELIRTYIALYPDAGHYTMSWKDPSPDHSLLGEALRGHCQAGAIANNDCRFMQAPYYWTKLPITKYITYKPHTDGSEKKANLEYRVWNPSQGRYSVGYFSVKSYFDAHYANPTSRVHTKDIL